MIDDRFVTITGVPGVWRVVEDGTSDPLVTSIRVRAYGLAAIVWANENNPNGALEWSVCKGVTTESARH